MSMFHSFARAVRVGLLPMRLPEGLGPSELALKLGDVIEIHANADLISPRCPIDVIIKRYGGEATTFKAVAAIETAAEVDTLKAGGILPRMLKNLVESQRSTI